MIVLKEGVDVRHAHYKMWEAAYEIEPIYRSLGADLVITAGLDGKHKTGSLHYVGCAFDIRTRNISDASNAYIMIKEKLSDAYDVVLHSTHIHIEYQPKTPEDL